MLQVFIFHKQLLLATIINSKIGFNVYLDLFSCEGVYFCDGDNMKMCTLKAVEEKCSDRKDFTVFFGFAKLSSKSYGDWTFPCIHRHKNSYF